MWLRLTPPATSTGAAVDKCGASLLGQSRKTWLFYAGKTVNGDGNTKISPRDCRVNMTREAIWDEKRPTANDGFGGCQL